MSKCKAVLDGEKIVAIQVKVKTPPTTLPGASGTKSPEQPKQVPAATVQQSK